MIPTPVYIHRTILYIANKPVGAAVASIFVHPFTGARAIDAYYNIFIIHEQGFDYGNWV
jgi:hypothetical protein